MPTGDREDPYSAFNFTVEIDGIPVAGFTECTGLNTETDAIEYRTGDLDITVKKLPGLKKFGNITLKRGFTDNHDLWLWRKTVLDGKTERRDGAVVLKNEARTEALRWTFREAWPRKWEGPAFNAKTNEVAIETLELVCEGIEMT
ncbi:MAG TPA: phage tail protein [Pyrinomonadaceae bacterium]|nr:phage tail protein [Pyrinomonadaceae bacterium]